MIAEVRVSWLLLFWITLSCAAKQYETFGQISSSMIFMICAHFLYANACHKVWTAWLDLILTLWSQGEPYIATTWDMTHEKFGWMLCFWNFAGVPFLYCSQSVFLSTRMTFTSPWLFAALAITYYIWDCANGQKNDFRKQVKLSRWAWPQFEHAKLKPPIEYIQTNSTPLLVDGWYRHARKIHYTCDIAMALLWGMACGFDHILPYFYVMFFTGMIIHRYLRDEERCSKKYGKYWEEYKRRVPYVFIPKIF